MLLSTLLAACSAGGADSGGGLVCGFGTHEESGACVANEDTGPDSGGDSGAESGDSADTGDTGDTGETGTDVDHDGYVPPEDCDDGDPEVHPGAVDVCGDGIDNDCNGAAAGCGWEGEYRLPADGFTLAGELQEDLAGYSVTAGPDPTGSGGTAVVVGAVMSDAGASDGGAVYLVPAPLTGDVDLGDYPRLKSTVAHEYAGEAVLLPGDLDGDGTPDLVVAAPDGAWGEHGYGGHVYVLAGPINADGTLSNGWQGETEDGGALGNSLAGGVDFSGDGVPDIVIGDLFCEAYQREGGAAYLLSSDAFAGGEIRNADARIYGDVSGWTGSSVADAGDLDGDGIHDLAVSSPYV